MGFATRITLNKLGYRRVQAADLIGVSPTTFDRLVKEGRMPRPCHVDGMTIWRGDDLVNAFNRLTGRDMLLREGDPEEWDEALGLS